MAELPILPLRVQSLLADTNHMSAEEFGAYCLLLFTMWQHGGRLSDDPKELKNISRLSSYKFEKYFDGIMRLMTRAGGEISQKRLTDTWLKVQELRRKRAEAATKRWRSENVHPFRRPK
jgi:uncharacterized protein YdaU (DUF1376 family)